MKDAVRAARLAYILSLSDTAGALELVPAPAAHIVQKWSNSSAKSGFKMWFARCNSVTQLCI